MSDAWGLALTVFLLLFNAYFVAAEFSLISARRTMIEPRALAGSRTAKITLGAMENVSLMMAGCQLGITICSLALGSLSEPAIAHLIEPAFHSLGISDGWVHPIAFTIALALVTFLHVVIGEMVPKNIALAGPDRVALVLAPALVLIVKVLYPVIWVLNTIANGVLRLFKIRAKDEVTSAFTRDEVANLVSESRSGGQLDSLEERLLLGALTFDEHTINRVLLPMGSVATLPQTVTPAAAEIATVQGFSRFPVTDDTGRLTGYVHTKDLLETDPVRREQPIGAELIRTLPTISITDGLRPVLETMRNSGAHLASVTGEDGHIIGMVTLEDVLEELVGQIRDDSRQR
ncbi:HlyC/CorC family transporter [Nakamurella silvestris]|nr:HlyC/CorC family transporter [Nakamurella silvestris]